MYHNPNNILDRFNAFASAAESPSAIEGFLSLAERLPLHAKIWQYVVFARGNLSEILVNRFSHTYPRLRTVNPRASVFQLTVPTKDNEKQLKGLIAVLPGSRPYIHRIIGLSYFFFWDRAVRTIVRQLYPDGMPVFFKQNEIKDALLSLERSLHANHRLRVAEVTMKKKRHSGKMLVKGQLDTDRLWTELSVQEVFDQALEHNQWFTSIRFKIEDQSKPESYGPIVTSRVSKNGELSFDFMYQEITDNLVSALEGFAAARLTLLQGRGIRERNYSPGLPIEIAYAHDIFSETEEVRRFGGVIAKYPRSTKAVFHANPYYHASVADFLDGSSFEIWILSPNTTLSLRRRFQL